MPDYREMYLKLFHASEKAVNIIILYFCGRTPYNKMYTSSSVRKGGS